MKKDWTSEKMPVIEATCGHTQQKVKVRILPTDDDDPHRVVEAIADYGNVTHFGFVQPAEYGDEDWSGPIEFVSDKFVEDDEEEWGPVEGEQELWEYLVENGHAKWAEDLRREIELEEESA